MPCCLVCDILVMQRDLAAGEESHASYYTFTTLVLHAHRLEDAARVDRARDIQRRQQKGATSGHKQGKRVRGSKEAAHKAASTAKLPPSGLPGVGPLQRTAHPVRVCLDNW